MTFFDKKEEVMKIELTPYGKYLFSIGKLKPHSYKFFDENVVYDSATIGVSEEQNQAHVRITEETPLLKGNPNITGVERNIKKFGRKSAAIKHMRQITDDDTMSTNNESIGSCAHETKNNSAMAIDIFAGQLIENSITNTFTSTNVDNMPIPQIPINMFVSSSVYDDVAAIANTDDDNVIGFSDGTGYVLDIKNPILRVREFNGFDEKDNFVLTAYKIHSSSAGWTYSKLRIPKRISPIQNDLLNEDIIAAQEGFGFDEDNPLVYNEEDLYFYINIEVDREIPDEEICAKVKDFELENIFLDDDIVCPEAEELGVYDIYGSLVTPDDLEDCD